MNLSIDESVVIDQAKEVVRVSLNEESDVINERGSTFYYLDPLDWEFADYGVRVRTSTKSVVWTWDRVNEVGVFYND